MRMPEIKQRRSEHSPTKQSLEGVFLPKANKYNARKTTVDNIVFHSAAEANRYKILKLLEKSGYIKELKLQVPMPYTHNGDAMFTYYADFTYYDNAGKFIIEDVKSKATSKIAVYRLKKKLVEAYYGIVITEVFAPR